MSEQQNSPEPIQLDAFVAVELVELAGGERKLPTEICLFRKGATETTKGQFVCDATAAKFTIDNVKSHYGQAITNFDYGHGQVGFLGGSYESARSAGWAKLSERDGALWATDIEWTPTATKALLDREFRFFSPTVYRDPETKRITNLVNVALTNLPATKGQRPIVTAQEHTHMSQPQTPAPSAAESTPAPTDLAALQASNAQLLSAVTSLQASLNASNAKLAEVEADRAKASKADLIARLSREGKLPPALQDWALSQDIAVLDAFGKAAPVIAAASSAVTAPATPKEDSPATLSDDDRKVCRLMAIPEAEFLSTRAHLRASGNFWAFDPLAFAPVAAAK
jgi:phage I-like protein